MTYSPESTLTDQYNRLTNNLKLDFTWRHRFLRYRKIHEFLQVSAFQNHNYDILLEQLRLHKIRNKPKEFKFF